MANNGDNNPIPPAMPEKIDLKDLAKRGDLHLSLRTAPPETLEDARLRRIKEYTAFALAVLVFMVILAVTVKYLFWSQDPIEKDVALKIIVLLATGIISFLFGRNTK